MVFFVCFSCGESLKKNQVEKHWLTKCRHVHRVSCMDCSKDFWGKEYGDHVKCITENEKYGGSQYVSKEMKGEKKQEAWIAHIKEKVANTHDMEPKLKELLGYITTFSNIPRKKEKFKNFLNNSAKVRNPQLVDKAWEVFQAASTNNNNNNKSNGAAQNGELKPANEPPDSTAPGQEDSQKSELNKRERKEERQKKNKKKEKKDRIVESTTELNTPTKRKCEDDESDAEGKETRKKRKKSKQEHVQAVCADDDGTSKKKKKKSVQEDKNGALVTSESHLENINSENHDTPKADVAQIPEKPENGKSKKKKKKLVNENENGAPLVNGNHAQDMNNGDQASLEKDAAQCSSAFKWKAAIRKVLLDAPEEGMKISKLQRKVISLYYAARGEAAHMKSEEELTAVLNKKLKMRNDKYILCKNRVKLRS